jgi:Ca2+-binding RTX toxin-like protein
LEGNTGNDLAIGGCSSIKFFSDNYLLDSIISTSPDVGKSDVIRMGDGNDIAIGGFGNDTIDGYNGTNILVGDSALLRFHKEPLGKDFDVEIFWSAPMSVESIDCMYGDGDLIFGGNGTDYIIGGALDDEVYGHRGADLVLGDHGKIVLYKNPPYKLLNVTTSNASCSPGQDKLYLGDGADIAFGGALGDIIEGGTGQDIILGDFGLYQDQVEFLPNQFYESITEDYEYAGPDVIDGGPDDDILMGQESDDFIEGGGGSDDIYGGHHKLFGKSLIFS